MENENINAVALIPVFFSQTFSSKSNTYPAKRIAIKYPPNRPEKQMAAPNSPTEIPNFVFCMMTSPYIF